MSYNMSFFDIIIRLFLGALVVITGWLLNTLVLFPVGMALVVVALSGYCPINHLLGRNPNKEEEKPQVNKTPRTYEVNHQSSQVQRAS